MPPDHANGLRNRLDVMTTLGRSLAFIGLTVAAFSLLLRGWKALIVATGGALYECDQGYCGTLGELNYEAGVLIPAAALLLSMLIAWLIVRSLL